MLTPASNIEDGDELSVLKEGFLDDPFYVWVAPDMSERYELLTRLFTLELGAAARRGFLFSDVRGVVLLVPPHHQLLDANESAEAARLVAHALQRPAGVLDDYHRRLEQTSAHISEAWFLRFLTVPAKERSQGNGTSLMNDIVDVADGTALWLHTGRPRTLHFFARWGLLKVGVTACEPAGPSIYTLLRLGG